MTCKLIALVTCFIWTMVVPSVPSHLLALSEQVTWNRLRQADMGIYEFVFNIPSRDKQPAVTFKLKTMATEIDQAEIVGDYLAVLGSIGTSAHIISFVAARNGEEKLTFLCWNPALSPDKRYLMYKIFYPRFTDPELISDVMAVYDLSALATIPSNAPTTARLKSGQIPPSEVGRPIYPESNFRQNSFSLQLDGVPHNVDTRYLWQDEKVVLLDEITRSTNQIEMRLVQVNLSKGSDKATVKSTALSEDVVRRIKKHGLAAIKLDKEKGKLIIEYIQPQGRLLIDLLQ